MKLLLCGLAALALAGCSKKSEPTTVSNTTGDQQPPADEGMTDGALWTCQISDYDPQPCKLSKTDGGWSLTKLLGSQRFRGSIAWFRSSKTWGAATRITGSKTTTTRPSAKRCSGRWRKVSDPRSRPR